MKFVTKAGALTFVSVLSGLSLIIALCLFYLSAGSLQFELLKGGNQEKIEASSTVVFSQLKKEFKIIAASRSADTVVSGSTQSQLPFSRDEFFYWAFFNAQAVIDMSKMKESDFHISGRTVYIALPSPELELSINLSKSRVITHDSQILSGPSQDPNLITKLQSQARDRISDELQQEGSLEAEATANAQNQIRAYFAKVGMNASFKK